MKVLLIYNPFAAHGQAKKILPEVEQAFQERGISFDLALTDYPEHGSLLAAEADFRKYDGIVAAGGDGTLFEVINGCYRNKKKLRVPIGVLPIGTGNAFARDLKLEASRWLDAVDIIAEGKRRKVDVGRFQTHGQTYYFLNILGLGFVADVTMTAKKLKMLGNMSYTLGVLYRTIRLKSFGANIRLDGKELERDCVFIEVSNTRYTSNFLMAPEAAIDDGLLDVTILNRVTRRRLLQAFPKVFTGEHVELPEVETFQAREISIETPDGEKVLTPDGEVLGISPVEITCLKQACEVFWK
ncbi:MAG: diacylglycerol kinase family lipid kinase [Acidobacteria bacterium]|nr:diacylglycerol kinase family lipid kinase [Acidobacteriota bacterium]